MVGQLMQENLITWISLLIVLSNLYVLSAGRLTYQIRGVAVQGVLLSLIPLFSPESDSFTFVLITILIGVAIKGLLIPKYLFRTIRDVRIKRETGAIVGYSFSLFYGITTSGFAFYLVSRIDSLPDIFSSFHLSAALAMAFTGLYLIIARKNVVSQIIGYLVLENAGFTLSLAVAASQPLFIEMGVMLDLLVGIFIMTVAVNHIIIVHKTMNAESLERLTQ